MNLRERFLQVMQFNTQVRPPKWELAYWGQTIDNWYKEGLPKGNYPKIPKEISTPTSSLYNRVWHSVENRLPKGIGVIGGGIPDTQSFPTDKDVRHELGMDSGQYVVDVNLLFCPVFENKVVKEDEMSITYIDMDGVTRVFMKETEVIPTSIDYPVYDRASWEMVKDERLNVKRINERFPRSWSQKVKQYKTRDCPLVLGGYPHGYFGTLATIMGYERLFLTYYDDPSLIHDIQKTFTEIWIETYSRVFEETDPDYLFIWEDMSAGKGSMISPEIIKEFMLPYYRKLTAFVKEHGVKIVFVDTDGDCLDIIPLLVQGGVTGMLPIEVSCGMDLLQVRRRFPKLQIIGGIPKLEIQHGNERIDAILAPVEEMLKYGGYIPTGDHFIPPEVHWKEFQYYRNRLNEMILRSGNR
jgi:uroporphyrinogen decarboxylase